MPVPSPEDLPDPGIEPSRKRRTKESLDKSEREEWGEKKGLKLNIQKRKIMASGLITSWQIDGETMETVTVFILRGSKITAGSDYMKLKDTCSLEEKL